jgi:Flp pilus assembly protein TadG
MRLLFKIALVVGLLAAGVAEAGSPVWTKTAVSVAANDAADAGAHDYYTSHDTTTAAQAAADAATTSGSHLVSFDVLTNGDVHVTVSREARSYVLYRISVLKKWYDVRASAAATPR